MFLGIKQCMHVVRPSVWIVVASVVIDVRKAFCVMACILSFLQRRDDVFHLHVASKLFEWIRRRYGSIVQHPRYSTTRDGNDVVG